MYFHSLQFKGSNFVNLMDTQQTELILPVDPCWVHWKVCINTCVTPNSSRVLTGVSTLKGEILWQMTWTNADPQKAVLSARGDKNGAPEKPVNTFVQPPQALQNHIDPKPSDTVQQNTVSSH